MKYPPLPDGIIIDGRRLFTSSNMRDYAITFHNLNTEILYKPVDNNKVVNDLLNIFKKK